MPKTITQIRSDMTEPKKREMLKSNALTLVPTQCFDTFISFQNLKYFCKMMPFLFKLLTFHIY